MELIPKIVFLAKLDPIFLLRLAVEERFLLLNFAPLIHPQLGPENLPV